MCSKGQVSGHIYAVSDEMCDIDPFFPPENAGLKTIPKDLFFYRQEMNPPSEAPDVFTYYGICEVYYESLILAKHQREEQAERRRSASPA
ncbi:hypothetical protein FNYG_07871 [Fusarium nygamai]|uniref:Uncharacterized protein n=1 Tax=Gibberella nygamai TaxID=42673 RepID=A0A2K0W8U8_GIBNY|nr:hypothetical protein FNYG_07871 [Fusarium nygamai]